HLLLQTLEEYGIQSRVGWHTGDNATSNDTCLEHLETLLRTKHNVKFTAKERRIRCIGHIINLSLQAFLLASSKEALTAALDAVTDVMGEELLAEFSSVLTSRQRNPRAQAQAVPQTSQRQRLSRRRRSVDSHGSVDEDFCG
ncbi:Tfo1 transposase, partial [Pyrenophora tritici-repentis]